MDWSGRRRRNEWEQGLGKEIQPLRGIYSLEVLERELLLAGVEDVPEVLDPHRRRSPEPEPEKKKTGSLTGSRNCGPAVRCGRVSNFFFFSFSSLDGEMAADRIRCGYPWVSVFRVSGFVLVFRPRFSGSSLGLVSGSVSGFGFHPWISNGYSK